MDGSTKVITGVLAANPSLLLSKLLLGAPVWNPHTIAFQPNKCKKSEMNRNTAKLLENIVLPDWILEYLRCPQSNGKLLLASQVVLDALTERARVGTLFTVLGRTISQVPSQGLVSVNGRWFYSMNYGIACLMADEAVDLFRASSDSDVGFSRHRERL